MEKINFCFDVRRAVDQEERGLSYTLDRDGLDFDVRNVIHLGVAPRDTNNFVGTLRLGLWQKNIAKIEHLAFLPPHRYQAAEETLLLAAEQKARYLERGVMLLDISADSRPQFYLDRGFENNGSPIIKNCLTHFPLRKVLNR